VEKSKLLEIIDSILPTAIEARHKIHKCPELAGEEFATSKLIRDALNETAIELKEPYLETDVVGILNGNSKGKNVTLRADIDALPLQEQSDLPYKSATDGIMHGCGHDGHTAILIGTALVLNQLREDLNGSVRFVFQPGEEVVAMGKDLVEAGALKNPAPDAVFALHADETTDVGVISSRPGPIMAAGVFFKIKVIGKGGHGAIPEATIDPILTGARIVEQLQSIVSRNSSPHEPLVISICRFESGLNANVIPDTAELEGTARYFNPELSETVRKRIEDAIKGTCFATGADYELAYDETYIPTINNADIVKLGADITKDYLGKDFWQDVPKPWMGSEDFSYYLKDNPGAFFTLGIGKDSPNIHNPKFNFNDEAIRNGILFMTAAALKVLEA